MTEQNPNLVAELSTAVNKSTPSVSKSHNRWRTFLVCIVSITIGFMLSSWYQTNEPIYGPIRDWYRWYCDTNDTNRSISSPNNTRATVGQVLPIVDRVGQRSGDDSDELIRTILPSGDVLVGDGYNSNQQLILYNDSSLLDDMITSKDTKTELRSMLSVYYDEREIPTMTI